VIRWPWFTQSATILRWRLIAGVAIAALLGRLDVTYDLGWWNLLGFIVVFAVIGADFA